MGYYAEFSFSVVIPTSETRGAEQALAESERFGKEFTGEFKGDLVEFLKEYWLDMGDDEIYFEKEIPALTALAQAAVDDEDPRGCLTIEGFTHQKWRSYAEDMFDILAPYIQPGSLVEIKGEEGEQLQWEFDGESRSESHATLMWPSELEPLRSAQKALTEIALIASAALDDDPGNADMHYIAAAIRAALSQPSDVAGVV